MDIFEFDNLDDLWAHVQDMGVNESREVRHSSQAAQGVFNDLERDERFLQNFTWFSAQYYRAGQVRDIQKFTVTRKSGPSTE